MPNPKLLTAQELADALNMKHRTIQRYTQIGMIPFVYLGHRTIRYNLEEVESALLRRSMVAKVGRNRKAMIARKGHQR